ncbi:MAG: hypothetical protein IPF47_24450 [Gemmatimonadetes bacterium]|nr:hypothetical protein [Gemmatimonadota bacterium]
MPRQTQVAMGPMVAAKRGASVAVRMGEALVEETGGWFNAVAGEALGRAR